jgi:dienelactone hydrolase
MHLSAAVVGLVSLFGAPGGNAMRSGTAADPATLEQGTVAFCPSGDQESIPERYRLSAHTFPYTLERQRELPNSEVEIYQLRFPSPVVTDCQENNTVYAEYYRPRGAGPFPGVIVLDITAGNQQLSRSIATCLAQNRIASLFVQMAYYGPRRPPGSKRRLLSVDIPHTLEAVRQTVLDLRRASTWLEGRSEIDAKRLGILGTSLGSFLAALTAEMEPKLRRVAILLGGGGLVDAYYEDRRAAPYRKVWEALGGTKEQVIRILAPVDPLTCAANLRDRRVLMIAAKRDEIVPPEAAEALWQATGKQKIVWYDCTHYGAVLYFVAALKHVVEHFGAE